MADNTFHSRTRPILGDDGIRLLEQPLIGIAGLGGVGGGTFLALVRAGVKRFRLAENGIFDPPDMNRQAAAFGSSMDRPKLDVYVELAKSINPDIELDLYPDGVTTDNLETFLKGSDAYVGVIDVEKGEDVKVMSPALLQKYDIPLFTCGAIGFGALMVNHHPQGMMPDEFWQKIQEKSDGKSGLMPSYLTEFFAKSVMDKVQQGFAQGTVATTSIGGLCSNALLASEVLAWILRDTELVQREILFAPHFATVDMINMSLSCGNIND